MTAVPTTPKGLRTWSAILDAAREVFGRVGFVSARMGDVADAAGLSMGGLYRYFNNKEDLFYELMKDMHTELYEASRSTDHRFAEEPYEALLDANRGYLERYYDNRFVMRAFIVAASVDERFRNVWWEMRGRHAHRFATSYRELHGVAEIDGVPVELVSDAMACMVEQCAYVWFGHEPLQEQPISVEQAAQVVTNSWYRTFFSDR